MAQNHHQHLSCSEMFWIFISILRRNFGACPLYAHWVISIKCSFSNPCTRLTCWTIGTYNMPVFYSDLLTRKFSGTQSLEISILNKNYLEKNNANILLVLAHSECYNKSTIGWLVWTKNIYFSQFCRLGSPRSDRFSVWWEPAYWFIDAVFSLCPHMEESTTELCGVSLKRALIPFMRALLSWPSHLSKTPPPKIPSHWG